MCDSPLLVLFPSVPSCHDNHRRRNVLINLLFLLPQPHQPLPRTPTTEPQTRRHHVGTLAAELGSRQAGVCRLDSADGHDEVAAQDDGGGTATMAWVNDDGVEEDGGIVVDGQ